MQPWHVDGSMQLLLGSWVLPTTRGAVAGCGGRSADRAARPAGQPVQRLHWSDKVVVVRPGCEPPTASDTRRSVPRPWRACGFELIGVFGPLEPRYGVKELIWIADMVRELHPTLRLLIVGDGPERPHLEKFARTAAVPENICFLGDRTDWRTLLPHLHVFWQGSNAEMDPPALVDAMAAGISPFWRPTHKFTGVT